MESVAGAEPEPALCTSPMFLRRDAMVIAVNALPTVNITYPPMLTADTIMNLPINPMSAMLTV